jgi:hypothetical protein
LPPLDVEFFSDGTVDFRLCCASFQHPRHKTTPLVYLLAGAFAVIVTLAGADESAFGYFNHSQGGNLYFLTCAGVTVAR